MYAFQFTSEDVGTPFTGIFRFASVPWGYPLSFLDPLMIVVVVVVVDLDSIDRDDSPLPDNIVASFKQTLVCLILGYTLEFEHGTSRHSHRGSTLRVAHVGLSRNFSTSCTTRTTTLLLDLDEYCESIRTFSQPSADTIT